LESAIGESSIVDRSIVDDRSVGRSSGSKLIERRIEIRVRRFARSWLSHGVLALRRLL
jgi:hypothetical protein